MYLQNKNPQNISISFGLPSFSCETPSPESTHVPNAKQTSNSTIWNPSWSNSIKRAQAMDSMRMRVDASILNNGTLFWFNFVRRWESIIHHNHCLFYLRHLYWGRGEGGLIPFHGCFWSFPSDQGFYLMPMCSVSLSEIHSVSQLNDGKPKLIEIFCGFLSANTYV